MPARIVGWKVAADSYAAWASATFEAHRLPPDRNGTPSRRASAAMTYRTSAGSGVPKVGAPDCIEIDDANDRAPPARRAGRAGRTPCPRAPRRGSGRRRRPP